MKMPASPQCNAGIADNANIAGNERSCAMIMGCRP
jgi:hypothetical protein